MNTNVISTSDYFTFSYFTKMKGTSELFPNWIFLPNGSWHKKILKIKIETPSIWNIRPKLYHKTNLTSETEGCLTKYIQSFAR